MNIRNQMQIIRDLEAKGNYILAQCMKNGLFGEIVMRVLFFLFLLVLIFAYIFIT